MRPILFINNNKNTSNLFANLIANHLGFYSQETTASNLDNIDSIIEKEDVALFIIGINSKSEIQFYLNKCRYLRIPYIFVQNSLNPNFNIDNIILPITNLEEEKEKGPFASSFARHFKCPIKIYQPNDYGSKAITNINAIVSLFDSVKLDYTITKGEKDSNKIELEAGILNNRTNNILIISASRDYGLDDLIFGPKERKIIKKIEIPIMLINPRGDLYTLCD